MKMAGWFTKSSTLAVLGCVLSCMLLVLVAPTADLPEFALHRGNAPVVLLAHASTRLAVLATNTAVRLVPSGEVGRSAYDRPVPAAAVSPNFLPILLQTLRR